MTEKVDVGLHEGRYRYCKNCNKLNKYKKALMYFETEEELSELTGLNHEELWEHSFDLDDWDFGFAFDIRMKVTWQLELVFERLDYNRYDKREVVHEGVKYIMYYH